MPGTSGQGHNTLVVADSRGEYESFFYLADSVIAGEMASFTVAGPIYGRKPLGGLQAFDAESFDRHQASFRLGNHKVVIKTTDFNPDMHYLEYYRRSGYLHKIDGSYFWGIDGKIPRRQISHVQIIIDGQPAKLPLRAYHDIYEPNVCSRTLFGKLRCQMSVFLSEDGQRLYVYMQNGRIPSLYEVTWIFGNGRYLGRVVDFAY